MRGEPTVTIDQGALDTIVAHAADARPRECCGLLVGKANQIVQAIRARNLADSANEFLIDPEDHIRTLRDARTRRLDVIGFYHSHPHSQARPSAKDLEQASYPDCLYLIAGVDGARDEVRGFRLTGTAFEEVELSVTAARAGLNLNHD